VCGLASRLASTRLPQGQSYRNIGAAPHRIVRHRSMNVTDKTTATTKRGPGRPKGSGKPLTESHKRAISSSLTGRRLTREQRRNISRGRHRMFATR
jgi:hypothetical protein